MKGLNDYEKFKIIHPLPDDYKRDGQGIPMLKPDSFTDIDWETIKFTSFSNIANCKDKENTIVLMFHYDKVLNRMWNDPLKYVDKFSSFNAIATPDFSSYTNMAPAEIIHNTFKNRWLGCFYQSRGIRVIPTVTWADKRTYDVCFSGLPHQIPVVISTYGCLNTQKEFLAGFNEMKKRIKPSLIIVRGKLIRGMTGNLIFLDFEDTYICKQTHEQIKLFSLSRIVNIEKEVI